ncbi:MAG: hypothetical protein E6G79_03360 [Alphaproteobacteria bacterium]|jgi:hypothetical protein|nr:MAG: hypothetical protein E6G79_03360 [Alphaproteobacteria bacterium]
MGTTTTGLYRRGNSTSLRMDHVRTGPNGDLTVQNRNADDWVIGKSGGVSCFDYTPTPGTGREWTLVKGSTYSDDLYLRDDQNGHWSWEPAVDMKLEDFKDLLRRIGRNFA